MLPSEKLEQELNTAYEEGHTNDEVTVDASTNEGQVDTVQKPTDSNGEAGGKPVVNTDPEPTSQNSQNGPDWELRFKSFKANADTTIHSLRVEVQELSKKNSDLSAEVSKLKAELLKANQEDSLSILSNKQVIETVGEDVAGNIADAIQKTVDQRVTPLQAELDRERKLRAELKLKEQERAEQEADQSFSEGYRAIIAKNGFDFDTINTDKVFIHSWLAMPDPITGIIRRETLNNALATRDVAAVAKLFVEYGRENESEMNNNVEPVGQGASAGNVLPSENDSKVNGVPTEEEINAYFDGGYKSMTQAECNTFEEKIAKAYMG